jgi:predicted amidohydrolase YtcJ
MRCSRKIPDDSTRDDHRRGVEHIAKLYASRGITSACEADTSPDDLQAYQDARDAGTLRYRAYCLMDASFLDRYIAAACIRASAIPWCGSAQSNSSPTAPSPSARHGLRSPTSTYRITSVSSAARARASMRIPARPWLAGFQLATHANGERAIDRMLGIYEQLQRESPRRDPRFRLEHCTVVTPELIARMQALGVIPVPFPAT